MFKQIRHQRRRRSNKRLLAALMRTYNEIRKAFQNAEVNAV